MKKKVIPEFRIFIITDSLIKNLELSLTHLIEEGSQESTGQSRLFVGGLPEAITQEQVRQMFQKFGEVKEVYIPQGKYSESLVYRNSVSEFTIKTESLNKKTLNVFLKNISYIRELRSLRYNIF